MYSSRYRCDSRFGSEQENILRKETQVHLVIKYRHHLLIVYIEQKDDTGVATIIDQARWRSSIGVRSRRVAFIVPLTRRQLCAEARELELRRNRIGSGRCDWFRLCREPGDETFNITVTCKFGDIAVLKTK